MSSRIRRNEGNLHSRSSLSLQFSPDLLHITEDSKEHEVTVHSTVPVPCYHADHGHRCGVPLALSVHDPGQTRRRAGGSQLTGYYKLTILLCLSGNRKPFRL